MPSLKRHSIELEGDEEEEEEDKEEEVPNPDKSNKRPRLSEQTLSSDEEASDLTDEEDDGTLDDAHIAEAVRQRSKRPSRAAENGIIESVTCVNFMCHSHLEVKLGPLINFVIGHNGSGKSAVLTALTICLGGKASSTNRANTLKAFIKEGQDSCTLCVRIKNQNGYQTDVYGDIIAVERTFTKTGTSGFKIKNSTNRTVATTKVALDDIMDFYALTLDNPICVLTQDMARQFLAGSNAADKYKFFIKGVQLEQLNQDYELLSESIDHVQSVFDSRQNGLRSLDKAMKETKRRLDMLTARDNIEERCEVLGAQMAWAQVEAEERVLEDLNKRVRTNEERVTSINADITVKSESLQTAGERLEAARQAEAIEAEKLGPLDGELQELVRQANEADREAEDARSEQRQSRDNQRQAGQDIQRVETEITEERQRLEEASGGTAAARLQRFEEAKASLAELQADHSSHQGRLSSLQEGKVDAERKLTDHANVRRAKAAEVSEAEEQLRSLKSDRNQMRSGFPPNMETLLSAITSAGGFRQKPVGPVGKFIRLLKPEWSSVLEKTFGTVLNAFIVTSRDDRERLSVLMKKSNCQVPINILSIQQRIDTSANEPGTEHLTVARVLDIEHDLVFNQLVIGQRIEQLLLIEDEMEASELMNRGRIANSKACYTLDQAKAGIGHAFTWNTHGNGLSTTFIDRYSGQPRMVSNIGDRIRVHDEYMRTLKDEAYDIEQHHRSLQEAVRGCSQQVAVHNKESQGFKDKISRAREALESIQDEIDNSTVQEGRLNVLQQALEAACKAKQREEEAYEAIVTNKDTQLQLQAEKQAQVTECQARLNLIKADIDRVKAQTRRRDDQRLEALRAKNIAHDMLTRAQTDREQAAEQRLAQDGRVQRYVQLASEVSERVPVPETETSDTLDAKLNKLIDDIKKFEAEAGGSKDQVSQQHHQAVTAYRSFEKAMKQENDLLTSMKLSLRDRQNRWRHFRKHISQRARYNFLIALSERAFTGKLAIDHDKRMLELLVQPNETERSSAARQTKTLSGGEKSFSTICLILSLWEAICAPVRCLDEYDVFMDSANREVSTKLLITAARQAQERQFIFITPQSMNTIPDGPDIRIIKMRDPERGQTTVSFDT